MPSVFSSKILIKGLNGSSSNSEAHGFLQVTLFHLLSGLPSPNPADFTVMPSVFFHFVSRDTCKLCYTLLKFRYTVSVLLSISPMKQTIEASLVLLIQSEPTQASSEHSFPRIQEISTYL